MPDPRYGRSAWKGRRAEQLRREPLCRLCEQIGIVKAASVADHVVPHRGDDAQFWTGELQSLCKACHDSAKQRQERSGALPGCDANGWPLDPASHWNTGG